MLKRYRMSSLADKLNAEAEAEPSPAKLGAVKKPKRKVAMGAVKKPKKKIKSKKRK